MDQKTFEFENIFIDVINEDKKSHKKYARLLDGISGTFKSGGLTAMLGDSGAGKTTLFDVLVGRIENSSKTYGVIRYNGKERTVEEWIKQSCYLKQFATTQDKFNIMENVMFNIDFYHTNKTKAEKIALAEEIIKMCCIWDKRFAYAESLSGGELKRAMIAQTLCGDAEVIFMDEPTSGLDSHSALVLINFMKEYAKSYNKIVVISLHQPGEALFNLFEDLFFLARGAVFYEGKLDKISSWLEENGMKKPEGISLAEYLFELHSETPCMQEIKSKRPIVNRILEAYRNEYDELRSQITLKDDTKIRLFTTGFSYSNMFTLWRRIYLNGGRSNYFIPIFIIRLLSIGFISFLTVLSYYFILKKSILTQDRGLNLLLTAVKSLKEEFTKDHYNIFTTQAFVRSCTMFTPFYAFFISNFLSDLKFIKEDLYSGKYSTVTCFVSYFLHDILSHIFWIVINPLILFLTPLRGLLNLTLLFYVLSYAVCFGINALFIKSLTNNMYFVFLFTQGFLSYPSPNNSSTVFFDGLAKINESYLGWCKYLSYIYVLLPNMILLNLIRYSEYNSIKNLVANGNEIEFLDVYFESFTVDGLEETVFDFLRFNGPPPL